MPFLEDSPTAGPVPGDSYRKRVAQIESGGNPQARNASGAAGLYQFMPATAAQYGLADPTDPVAAGAAFDRFTADNRRALTKSLGREPSEPETYLAHQQGAAGAAALLQDPKRSAVDALTAAYGGKRGRALAAIVQNGGTETMTAGEFAGKQMARYGGQAPAPAQQPGAPPAEITAGLAPQVPVPAETTTPMPPIGKVFDAAMTRGNTIGSIAEAAAGRGMSPPDPNFDPFTNIKGYEPFAASFIDAQSDADVARIKQRIDQELKRADLIDSAGALGVAAEVLVGLTDPINLVPIGGSAVMAGRLGYRVGKSALRVGAAAGLGVAAQEAILQETQETRSGAETAVNVAAGTFLGGVLGGAVGAFAGRDLSALAKGALEESDVLARITDRGSVGAAATKDTTLAQEGLVGAMGTEKVFGFMAPTVRAAQSDSIETRRVMEELAELPLQKRKNTEGIASATAVESNIRQWKYPLAESLTYADDQFVQYRLGRERKFGDVVRLGVMDLASSQPKLSRTQFLEEVGRAMRRGDQHEIPEVAAAAKKFREKLFDPLKEAAIEAKILDPDVDPQTALSYLTRVWDHQKLAARSDEFVDITSRWYMDEQAKKAGVQKEVLRLSDELDAATARIKALEGEQAAAKEKGNKGTKAEAARKAEEEKVAALREALEEQIERWEGNTSKEAKGALARRAEREIDRDPLKARLTSADDAVDAAVRRIKEANLRLGIEDMRNLAYETLDRIKGTPDGRLPYDLRTPDPAYRKTDDARRGPLAGRVFMIPDKLIEPFLVSDIFQVARIYERSLAPDVELARRFGRVDMQDQVKAVQNSYAQLRESAGGNQKELKRLDEALKADIRDIAAVRDRLRGTFALPDDPSGLAVRAARVVKDLNYLRLLGGMTLSAIPDIGRAVMQHGIERTVSDGIVPLLRNWQLVKLSAREVQMSGTALDMVLDSRSMAIADVMDDFGRGNRLERGIHAAANKFGIVTLMAPWNAALKQFVGIISQTRSLQAIEALVAGKISAKEATRLAAFGIDEAMGQRIGKEFAAHGRKESGAFWANTADWTDLEAARVYRAALAKEVDAVIVTPGQEKPLWLSTQLGSVLGQFKSFSMVSTQRVLMAGLQQRDMAALNGALMMTGLGMLSFYLKADESRFAKATPATLIKEGIDRSGLTGVLFDVNNIVEKATRGAVGISRLTGTPLMTRYASRNAVDAVLGPTAGALSDVVSVTGAAGGALMGESLKAADVHAVRRMVPFQNAIGWTRLFDAAEEGLTRALGAPPRK